MRTVVKILVLSLVCLLPIFPAQIVPDLEALELSQEDSVALGICAGVIQLFRQSPDAVWPGYDLAERPFIFYMPERWVLLLNYSGEPEGFTSYPQDWPDLGTEAMLYEGQYEGLVGQLAFNLPIDSVRVAAVGFQQRSPLDIFGYIVHENFHQHQFGAFGDIHWEREERYPIQERENTALAYLEMRLLMDALETAAADKKQECRDCLSQFVAVRYLRWERADSLVRGYEQGEEINEGTAQYVEMKSYALLKQMESEGSGGRQAGALSDEISSISMPDYLLGDFRERLAGNSISPADMSRYRIYPVGSAQGLLLDYLGIDWKLKAQDAGPEFTFAGLFKDHFNIDESQFEGLLAKAKKKYTYDEVLVATDRLIQEYEDGFKTELAAFELQPGYRVEVDLSTRGERLSRSRSSSADKWVVDNGTRELRSHYNVYVLKSDNLLIELQDMGVLEEYDWDAGRRQVSFWVDETPTITLDGSRLKPVDGTPYRFADIEILGDRAKVRYLKPGTVTVSGRDLKVNPVPASD